jgi:radical SAM superfamily enzyme YgiQ (UPF0313 family)
LKKTVKIFLADLAHTYSTSDAALLVPLNIGYLKAYAQSIHGSSVDITLFKHPEKLLSRVEAERPDIIGLSNYGWNENLNRAIGGHIRKTLPEALIVSGGPNIDSDPERQLAFFDRHKYLDFIILDGGEEPFSELITWWTEGSNDNEQLPQNIIWSNGEEILSSGLRPPIKKNIEGIPSPYLCGYLDEFLYAGMVPIFETNRGCPYKCTFCSWGSAAKDRVGRFDLETGLEEVDYVGQRTRAKNWIIADANFGIFPRDIEIAKAVRRVKDENGFPEKCHIWLAKNVTERNIEIGEILGDMIVVFMSVQSLSDEVLENIKRANISLDTYIKYHEKFRNLGSDTFSELIIPMPGETADGHKDALRELFDIGVDIIYNHNIRLLAGAEINSTETREDFKFNSRFRLIHGDAGIYKCPDGTSLRAFEYEESVRETTTMGEAELFYFRKLHFLIDFFWNLNVYKPMLKLASIYGINPLDVLLRILDGTQTPGANQGESQRVVSEFFDKFDALSHSEWFDSAEDIETYFSKDSNFQALANQEFDKLNILFSVTLLKDYKSAFDLVIRDSVMSFEKIPEPLVGNFFSYVSCLFPQLNTAAPLKTINFPENLMKLTSENFKDFKVSSKQKQLKLVETSERFEILEILQDAQGKTLSKVLNARGVGSLMIRNLQMKPAESGYSLPFF